MSEVVGRWTAQKNDVVGGWIVTCYPHPLSEHHRYSGDPDVDPDHPVLADTMTEADAKYIAFLVNAHELATTDQVEARLLLKMALVGTRHRIYFTSPEFNNWIGVLLDMIPALVTEYAEAAEEQRKQLAAEVERRMREAMPPFVDPAPEGKKHIIGNFGSTCWCGFFHKPGQEPW